MSFTKMQRDGKMRNRAIRVIAKLAVIVASAAIAAGVCFAQGQAQSQAQPQSEPQSKMPKHAITVTFDYDFTALHACSPKVTKKCIAKFIVYDISGQKPYKLFTIPAPANASGSVKGISGESQTLLFESGKHLLAVTTQKDSGEVSSPYACSVWATIPVRRTGLVRGEAALQVFDNNPCRGDATANETEARA
jgi:hypothetical protein